MTTPDPSEILGALREARRRLEAHEARERAAAEPIAVVGLSCRFPGGAYGAEAYAALLREGRDGYREIDRWDLGALYDPDPLAEGKVYLRTAGLVEDVDHFDASFFGISHREATSIDPQQRLLLELAWEALEHAGHAPRALRERAVGVFVGASSNDYLLLALRAGAGYGSGDPFLATAVGLAPLAGRIAYTLGLTGPAFTLDTACSSSLMAVHLACQSLRRGETEVALAGGVQLMLAPDTTIALCRTRVLARDGRCKTFDERADGMGRGEGAGWVVLKRLADATRDGDRIHALLLGSVANQDGATSGFSVPNGAAQTALVEAALAAAHLGPDDVGLVEAHGTGTTLGDPIELEALGRVFRGRTADPLLVTSVKANLGHLEAAAGIAGLIKVVLARAAGEVPPHVGMRTPTSRVDWRRLPLRVPLAPEPWPAGRPAGGVSAFGLTGTNVHVLVGPAPTRAPPLVEEGPVVLPLAARTPAALRALAAATARQLRTHPELALAVAAATAQRGRVGFAERLALVTTDGVAAARALAAFAADGPGAAACTEGVELLVAGTASSPATGLVPAPADPRAAARLFVDGVALDWAPLHPGGWPERVPLPTYPFERNRYWLPEAAAAALPREVEVDTVAAGAASPAARPRGTPAPRFPRPPLATPLVAPRGPLEAELAATIAEVLRLDEVGVRDEFFELGGDSLLAAQVARRFEESTGRQLRVGAILERGTVERIAHAIETGEATAPPADVATPPAAPAAMGGEARAAAPPRTPGPGEPIVHSLSPDQRRLWFLDQLYPRNPAYHVPAAVRVRGPLERAAVEEALAEVVARHESLRTHLVRRGDEAVAVVEPALAVPLGWDDLAPDTDPARGSEGAAHREAAARALADAEARAPFELERPPLFRVRLARLGEGEHLLLVTLHHLIGDAWSAGLLVEELLHAALAARGLAPPLGPPPTPARLQLEARRRRDHGEELAYWRTQLAGVPVLALPADAPWSDPNDFRGGYVFFEAPARTWDALVAHARASRVTPFMMLLAAWDALLQRLTGSRDLPVGTPVALRDSDDARHTIGLLANTLVIRVQLPEAPDFPALLEEVRRATTAAFDHRGVPFDEVVRAVRPARADAATPLFQTMFSLVPVAQAEGSPFAVDFFPQDVGSVDYELFLTLWPGPSLRGVVGHRLQRFGHATGALLARAYVAVLEQLADEPTLALSALRLPEELAARARRAARPPEAWYVAATFTAEPVADVLAFWGEQLGAPASVSFADFGQVFPALLDPASPLGRAAVGVLFVRLADWRAARTPLRELATELVSAVRAAAARAPIVVVLCPDPADATEDGDRVEAALALRCGLEGAAGIAFLDGREVLARYPVAEVFDPAADHAGAVPYTRATFIAFGTAVARAAYALRRAPFKVVTLDCDQTLWSGVVGEDGPDGVSVDPPRRALMERLAELGRAGVLLCLASKNHPDDVWEVFRRHPDLPLRREDFIATRLDWEPKPDNLTALARELGLGLDAFVFLDDSAVECAEMRARCPAVTTLRVPTEPEGIAALLEHAWPFDLGAATAEDQARGARLRTEAERGRALAAAGSFARFYETLGLEVDIAAATLEDAARVGQLSQRTNQFNTTAVRLGQAEAQALVAAPDRFVWVARVRDRFGEYGLSGALWGHLEDDAVVVDDLLLSCRTLGRGVEHRLVAALGRHACQLGRSRLVLRFAPSGRNAPAHRFLAAITTSAGDLPTAGGAFVLAAERAAAVRFEPDRVPEVLSEAASATSAASARPEAAALAEIAESLWSVEAIARALEAWRPRPARLAAGAVTAPASELERSIAAVWQEVLGVPRVGLEDNFFDLGGHSLLLVQVASRLHGLLGRHVPVVDLFAHPTVGSLAAHLAGDQSAPAILAASARRGQQQRATLARLRKKHRQPR